MKSVTSMNMQLTHEHKISIDHAINRLRDISGDERSFIQLELLYYNILSIARAYGNNINENAMLAGLKQIECNEYKHAQERFKTSSKQNAAIQKFRMAIRKELSSWIKE
jgi:hypothetical protein